MKEKKQAKDWGIACTHYLTAGCAMPFIIGLVLGIPAAIIIGENNIIPLTIVLSAIRLLGIWAGVIYAAKYVNKTYIVKNSENTAKWATIYLGVLGGGHILINLLVSLAVLDGGYYFQGGPTGAIVINIMFFAVGVAIFYTLSKKYIKNSEVIGTQQE